MSDILDFEVWTLPTSPTFEKKFDIKPLEGGTGTVGLSEYGDGSMHLPRFHPRLDEIVSDTKRSWIVVKKDGTIIDEFKADRTRKPVKRPSAVTVTGRQRNGLIEGIGVYPKEDREDAQDWKWGFENILPPLGLEDLGNVREEWKLYNDQTAGGTFTVTVEAGGSSDTTESLDFDISANGLEGSGIDAGSGLQGLSTVDDVTVSGEGTEDKPWIITFYNPPDPTNVSVTDAGGLTSTLNKTVEGGLDPDPVTKSKPVDAGTGDAEDHGDYDDPPLEVVTDPAFVNTGSDYAIKCNAVSGFAGEQIAPLDVTPGETYSNLTIPVYPTKTGSYVIVVRDIFGGRIARKIVSLTAGSYQDLTIDKATIPSGVNQVIYRVAYDPVTTGDTDADPFYVDWQGATFIAGEPEATFTEIVRTLLEDAQSRGTATFLELDATDAADSNGTALSATSFTAFVGDNSHMGHVMADGKKSGYHWRIVNAARANAITPEASTTHVLQIFFNVDGELEDTTGDDEAPYVYATAGVSDAETAERTPPYTVLLGLGSGTLKVEDTNAAEVSGEMGRVERVVDVEHLGTTEAVQQFLDAQFAEEENNRKAARAVVLGTANMIPGVDYGEGSKIWWHFPGQLAREARVVRRFTWTHGKTARFEVQGSEILTPEDAQAKALDHLLNQLRRRRRGKSGLKALDLAGLKDTHQHGVYTKKAVGNAAAKTIYENGGQGHYDPASHRTYIAYLGLDRDLYVTYYDHHSETFAASVKADDRQIAHGTAGGETASHGAPSICVDNNGHIQITHGTHNTEFRHVKSTNPWDISAWTAQTLTGADGTYSMLRCDPASGDLYLIYRAGDGSSHGSPFPSHAYGSLRKSTDEGSNWSSETAVFDMTGGSGDNDFYPLFGGFFAEDGYFHIAWSVAEGSGHDDNRNNIYHAYLDPTDDTWYAADGTSLGSSVDFTEASNSCLAATITDVVAGNMAIDGEKIAIAYRAPLDGDRQHYVTVWDGTSWTDTNLGLDAADVVGAQVPYFSDQNDLRLLATIDDGTTGNLVLYGLLPDGTDAVKIDTLLSGSVGDGFARVGSVVNGGPIVALTMQQDGSAEGTAATGDLLAIHAVFDTAAIRHVHETVHNHDSDYAALGHTHDDRYYTESEVDTLIDGVESSGEILISNTPSTPLVFADLLQNEDQDDLVYSD